MELAEGVLPHVHAVHQHLPVCRIVEARNQLHQGGFRAARAANHAHGGPGGDVEVHLPQGVFRALVVGKIHPAEADTARVGNRADGRVALVLNGRRRVEHLVDAGGGGRRLGENHHQVGHHHQRQKNLRHVVDEGHHLALGEIARIHPHAAEPQDGHNAKVQNQEAEGRQHGVQLADGNGVLRQVVAGRVKALLLALLLAEGPHHPCAGKVLPGNQRHAVGLFLDGLEEGHRAAHDDIQHQRHQGHNGQEHQRQVQVNAHGHDHRADDQEGRAHHKTDQHGHRRLQLVDVGGHAGDERGRAKAIQLPPGQGVDVMEQTSSQVCAHALGGSGGHGLAGQGRGQTHHAQQHQQRAPLPDVGRIAPGHAHVDHVRHHQGHNQLKNRFNQLENRP